MSTHSEPDQSAAGSRYAGLITRGFAFVVDAVAINVVAVIVEVAAALIVALLHLPKDMRLLLVAIGSGAYVLWSIVYFVAFWSTTGQTPGSRLMGIRVISADSGPLSVRRGIVRCVGIVVAAVPLFAGYLPILYDGRRRGIHDRLAGSIVIEQPQLSLAAELRERRRAAARRASGRSSVSGDDGRAGSEQAVSGRESRV